MTQLSQTILDHWQIRKTKAQKTAFIDFMKAQLPGLQVEEGGFPKSRNLVLGDVKTAKVLLTAHYDTCAQLPFPNFITPKNILFYLLYSLLISAPFIALFVAVYLLGAQLGQPLLGYWGGFLVMMGSMYLVMMGGKANKHTANDNTSGVIILCEIYAALPEEVKSKVCFVFFDNEENGLLGSSQFAKAHKKDSLKDKLVLNFDCVSDGDHLLFVLNKPAQKQHQAALEAAFYQQEGKTVEFVSTAKAFYPSDQANFPVNAAVAALKEHKFLGLYMDKIHTKHDTAFDEKNIALLTEGTLRLTQKL